MGLLRILVRGIGLISTVILARLLVPADFGLIAMATSIIAFLQLATAFSFDIPLIQKQDADRSYFDSAWTLNVMFYVLLTVVLMLLAAPAATFYREPRLEAVIYVLAAGFLIQGFENIGIVYFRKELDFRQDFILMLSQKVAGFLVTIPLAFLLRSYWALIAGMVLGNFLGVILSYVLHPFRPRFSVAAVPELFSFSKWLMLNNVVNFLRQRSPDFIIGRISGTSSLGIFTVAYEISTLPTTELVAPINRVVFPGYSKLSSNIADLRQSYLDVLSVIAIVALPAGFGIAAISTPLVDFFLGSKWVAAGPIVGILAVYGGINAIHSNTASVFNAIGKPHLITWIGVVNILVLITSAIALALLHGPTGVAAAYLGTTILITPLVYFYVCREVQLRYRQLMGVIWRPVSCSVLMYASISAIAAIPGFEGSFGPWAQLAILVPLGAILYLFSLFGLWVISGRPTSAEYRLLMFAIAKMRSGRQQSHPSAL